jgi:hypothetical protein
LRSVTPLLKLLRVLLVVFTLGHVHCIHLVAAG